MARRKKPYITEIPSYLMQKPKGRVKGREDRAYYAQFLKNARRGYKQAAAIAKWEGDCGEARRVKRNIDDDLSQLSASEFSRSSAVEKLSRLSSRTANTIKQYCGW